MAKRLFLGIPLPTSAKDHLSKSIEPLQILHPNWRWVKKENYHITVSFFGSIEEEALPNLVTHIQSVVESNKPFTLKLDKLFLAPPHSPRMLWVVGTDNNNFKALVSSIEKIVTEKIPLLNYQKNHHPAAHVTLARFDYKSTEQISLPDIHLGIPVTSCILFESVLSPKGATYTVFQEYILVDNSCG